MKKRVVILLLFVIILPVATAFSFDELFSGFFIFTGMAVLEVGEEKSDSSNNFEKISVPDSKHIEVEEILKEESDGKFIDVKKEISDVDSSDLKKVSDSSSKKKFIPECSDFLDNNVNYLKKGKCKDNTRKLLNKNEFEDYCSEDGITLMEYFCNSIDTCEGSWYVCPNGCEKGSCLTELKNSFVPDLKIVSVSNNLQTGVISVKNKGSKGTYFKTKVDNKNIERISEVNYYIEPGESINIQLKNRVVGNYSVELLVEEDLDLGDNFLNGSIIENSKEQKLTGQVTLPKEIITKDNPKSIVTEFFEFFINLLN